MRIRSILVVGLIGLVTNAAQATNWDESINGDLSGNRLAPTNLGILPLGTTTVSATSVSGDREFWRITIPAGSQFSQLILSSYSGIDGTAFNAIQAGATFTENPDAPNVANILGYSHFGTGPGNVGTDILDDMGLGAGSIGFTPPLPAGTYTFWTQQANASCSYTFSVVVTAVAFPASDYAEAVNGDLSGNRLAPTNLGLLSAGTRTLAGSTVSGDLDYFRIHVPNGSQLTQMNLTHFASADDLGFISVQAGTTFTEDAATANPANLLGYAHFGTSGAAVVGTDILDNIGTGAGSIGFTPPLNGGDYTFWIQQTNTDPTAYRFSLVVATPAPATYDESVNGDLSGNRLAPTNLGVLAQGSNTLAGTTVAGDLDYFRINVPAGKVLSQMVLVSFLSTDDLGFISVQAGTTFTEDAATANPANLLGYTHFGTAGTANPGTDILDNIGTGAGSIQFTPPLAAGDYTFWVQQTNAEYVDYKFNMVIADAPPPPSCTGDINNDGFTNVSDFNILASHYGQSVTINTNGDLDGSGNVNVSDFNVLAGAYGCHP